MAKGWTKEGYDREAFGQLLEGLRAECGLSYGDLQQATGIAKASIQQAGRGGRSLPEQHRRRLIEILGQTAAAKGKRIDRRRFLRLGGLGAVLLGSRHASTPPPVVLVQDDERTSPGRLLEEADHLASEARWLEGETKALAARAKYVEGSMEWADITLRYCAQMRQQAGDIMTAKFYLRDVEERYIHRRDQPDPRIVALHYSQQGWIADEQEGNFPVAYTAFNDSLGDAREAGDAAVLETGYHFRLRILCEDAMTKLNAWLGLSSGRQLSDGWLRRLSQVTDEAWRVTSRLKPDDPHVHFEYRRFLVLSMTRPYLARQEIPKLRALARETGSEHHLALSLARWEMGKREWETGAALAREAFEGFAVAAYPAGLAIAGMIRAEALLRMGLATSVECRECLDLWVLALIVHPYTSHPLWSVAVDGLGEAACLIDGRADQWLRSYFEDLDFRAWRRDGVFAVLSGLTTVLTQAPSLHVRHLLPESLRGKLWPELVRGST